MDILIITGFGLAFIGSIGLLIAAFRVSLLWGLWCLLISPVALVFLFMHWDVAKNPFLLQLLGCGVILLGIFMQA